METKIPKEIKDFKEKFFLMLTLRQLIWGVISAAVTYLGIYLCKYFRIEEYQNKIIPFLVLLPVLIGFVEIDGMPFEKYLVKIIEFSFNPKYVYKGERENEK